VGKRTSVEGWDDGRTSSAGVLRPMLEFARTRGVDVDALLAELELPSASFDDLDFRIPETLRDRAWRKAASAAGDSAFGLHVAQHAKVGAFEVLDYALSYSATLEEGLERMLRFHRLLTDALEVKLDVRGSEAHLRRMIPDPERHQNESVLAVIVLHSRVVTGRDIVPRRVRFTHPTPDDVAPHAALFRCPVEFGRPFAEIVFEASDLALPALRSDPALTRLVDHYMAEHLARLPELDTFVHRVKGIIAQSLSGGRPTLRSTARALRASPRSVQRRLHDQGATLRELVEETRRSLAARLIDQHRLSITEIAFLLGFSDVGSFRRTFKRWTGKSPGRSRRPSTAATRR
jgi:AraC-like DNA-binding protein